MRFGQSWAGAIAVGAVALRWMIRDHEWSSLGYRAARRRAANVGSVVEDVTDSAKVQLNPCRQVFE